MLDDPQSSMMTTPKDVDEPPKAPTQATKETWKLHTDVALSKDDLGLGIVLTGTYGDKSTYALRFKFKCSNNAAEYEALLAGLRLCNTLDMHPPFMHLGGNPPVSRLGVDPPVMCLSEDPLVSQIWLDPPIMYLSEDPPFSQLGWTLWS
uniref:Reverse transcriptase domain-containing protein n=1 Tax=Lactuca sativa TaxID=4236 RepID=A0A9R1XUE1_LACSA|nr:hypothetical protein LSAT_V11C200077180 [Lactuca sativa]